MIRRSRLRTYRTRPNIEALEAKQLLTTFMVTSVADSGPGSLREAILDADSDAQPSGGVTTESIQFAIPGAGVQTIAPTTPLPTIDQPTAIDATTQPGYTGSPLIVLDGLNAVGRDGGPVVGLKFTVGDNSSGTAIRGLGIIRFSGSAIQTDSSDTEVSGVVIGTDAAGGKNLGNGGYGIKFGISGGNSVTNSVIENSGLRAIGGGNDAPGVPFASGPYCTTQRVAEANNDTKATELVVSAPSLTTPTTIDAVWGSEQTLTFTVTNTGPVAATDVTLALYQNPFTPFLSISSATASQGTAGTTLSTTGPGDYPATATLGTLAPGASATLTMTVQIGSQADQSLYPSGFGQLIANAYSPQLDYDPGQTSAYYDFQASDPPAPPPTLAVSVPGGSTVFDEYAQWGSVATLTYTVTNPGSVAIDDVTVALAQATFSHLLSVISATTTQGTIGDNLSIDDDHPAFATIGTLAPGASATLTVVAQVGPEDPNDAEGDIITATASAPQVDSIPVFDRFAEVTVIPNETGQPPEPTMPSPPMVPPIPVTGTPPPTSGTEPIVTTTPPSPTGPTSTTVGSSPSLPVTSGSFPIGVVVSPPSSADLAVSAVAPAGSRVGTGLVFTFTVKDIGTTDATDAVAALDLGGVPSGSFSSISSINSASGPGRLVPVQGRPGVYEVDLGSIAAGASATVAVLVIPDASGPIDLNFAVSDAVNPLPDLDPANNFVSAGAWVAPKVQITDVEVPTTGVVQLNFDAALTASEADNVANYRLTTSGTAAGTTSTSTVKVRSATYDSANHRVTLYLAHPLSVGTSKVRVAMAHLGTTGNALTAPLHFARKR